MTSRFISALRLFCMAGAMLVPSQVGQADVPREVAEAVASAVVGITATRCAGLPHERSGTGFAYQAPDQIVTDYHVVAGCGKIELWYERVDGQPRLPASLVRVLIRGDLALLQVDAPPTQSVLTVAGNVNRGDVLKAIGYVAGQPTLGDLDLSISIGSDVLRDMLPHENLVEISRDTGIDIDARIYRFSRPLFPGMSGGPIFDGNGELVAIVAGGLKNGAVAASWGWPASFLADLSSSQDPISGTANTSPTQFAYPSNRGTADVIQCGELEFENTGRLSFGEVAKSSDNSLRLDTTVAFSGSPRAVIEELEFNRWVHGGSGATVLVPADAELVSDGDSCSAKTDDGIFQMIVWGTAATNPAEVQEASQAFETRFMASLAVPNIGFYPDQVLSFNGPQSRQDGLTINRKSFFIGKNSMGPGRFKAMHQFETIMARGGSFVGVASVNNDVEQCFNQFNQFVLCNPTPLFLKKWAHFVLATQLSTYPFY
ncbi:serine protease [Mesorhizobium sp. M0136]|uniref:S1 family peptidase n=1 Tax=Mesorhizobium sp. M0136 TaxID=2956890 RepID=UPI003334DC08